MTKKSKQVEKWPRWPGWAPPLKTFKITVPGPVRGVQGPGPPGPEDQRTRGPGPGADDETHHALALKRCGGYIVSKKPQRKRCLGNKTIFKLYKTNLNHINLLKIIQKSITIK